MNCAYSGRFYLPQTNLARTFVMAIVLSGDYLFHDGNAEILVADYYHETQKRTFAHDC